MGQVISLALMLSFVAISPVEEVKLVNHRPSSFVTFFAQSDQSKSSVWQGENNALAVTPKVRLGRFESSGKGVIPKGVILEANDTSGILRILGSKENVNTVKHLISLFDIQSRKVKAQIEIRSPGTNFESKTNTELSNNRAWEMSDVHLDLRLRMTPRINDDGSITPFLSVWRDSKQVSSLVVRLKPNQSVVLKLGEKGWFKTIGQDQLSSWDSVMDREPESKGIDITDPSIYIKISFEAESSQK